MHNYVKPKTLNSVPSLSQILHPVSPMATRCYRSISRPTINLLKSGLSSSSSFSKPTSIPSFGTRLSSPSLPRSVSQLGCLQSLLPLHSAVSSARLTSRLAIDSKGSRSLSLELGLSMPR